MSSAKSLNELGSLYTQMITESKQESDKVGGKLEIGEVKLTKGGDEKVKKDLETPKEKESDNGEAKDADKELFGKKTIKESNTMKSQSAFDKVLGQIFSENADDQFGGGQPEAGPTAEGDGLNDDISSIPGEQGEEEVIDPVALFADICASVEKLKKHFGVVEVGVEGEGSPEGGEGELDISVGDDEPAVGESADSAGKKLPDSKGKSLQGAKKSADVGGTKVVKKKASADITTGDGKLEKAPDGEKQAGGKDNKVKASGAVKGGNASAFE